MGPGWKIEGTVSAAGDLEVLGSIDGEVRAEGELFVAKGGRIVGTVRARHIRVAGEVEGALVAEEGIELLAGCAVNADLRARRLSMAQGASFQGAMDFDAPPAREEERPAQPDATTDAATGLGSAPAEAREGEATEQEAPAASTVDAKAIAAPIDGVESLSSTVDRAAPPAAPEAPAVVSVDAERPSLAAAGGSPVSAKAEPAAPAAPPALPPSALRFGPLPLRIAE